MARKSILEFKTRRDNRLYVVAMPWDDFKAPLEFVEQNVKTLTEAHVDRITICDTYGDALPWAMEYVMKRLKKAAGKTPLELHIHNDFGLATAGALGPSCRSLWSRRSPCDRERSWRESWPVIS